MRKRRSRISHNGLIFTLQKGFDFDFVVDVGPPLSLAATFVVNVQGVNPVTALAGAIESLDATLQNAGSEFEAVVNTFQGGFDNANQFLAQIAASDGLTLALDAVIDLSVGVDLSTDGFAVSSELRNLSSAFLLQVEESFSIDVGEFEVEVSPAISLELHAENTAVPFNLFTDFSMLGNFDFGGSFDSRVVVTVEGVPAAVTFEAVLPDVTNASTLDFDVFVDIDLYPIRESELYLQPVTAYILLTYHCVLPPLAYQSKRHRGSAGQH